VFAWLFAAMRIWEPALFHGKKPLTIVAYCFFAVLLFLPRQYGQATLRLGSFVVAMAASGGPALLLKGATNGPWWTAALGAVFTVAFLIFTVPLLSSGPPGRTSPRSVDFKD
jgi:hypothetical protein